MFMAGSIAKAGGERHAKPARRKTMMIKWNELYAALTRLEPWSWRATDWRRLSNGRIVRFVNWGWRRK